MSSPFSIPFSHPTQPVSGQGFNSTHWEHSNSLNFIPYHSGHSQSSLTLHDSYSSFPGGQLPPELEGFVQGHPIPMTVQPTQPSAQPEGAIARPFQRGQHAMPSVQDHRYAESESDNQLRPVQNNALPDTRMPARSSSRVSSPPHNDTERKSRNKLSKAKEKLRSLVTSITIPNAKKPEFRGTADVITHAYDVIKYQQDTIRYLRSQLSLPPSQRTPSQPS